MHNSTPLSQPMRRIVSSTYHICLAKTTLQSLRQVFCNKRSCLVILVETTCLAIQLGIHKLPTEHMKNLEKPWFARRGIVLMTDDTGTTKSDHILTRAHNTTLIKKKKRRILNTILTANQP